MATAKLPKGYTAITGLGDSWDFQKKPLIEGTIVAFKEMESKKYFDTVVGKGGKKSKVPKTMRLLTLATKDGNVTVWEKGGLRALFEMKKGSKVAIAYTGKKKIPGQKNPMYLFEIGRR